MGEGLCAVMDAGLHIFILQPRWTTVAFVVQPHTWKSGVVHSRFAMHMLPRSVMIHAGRFLHGFLSCVSAWPLSLSLLLPFRMPRVAELAPYTNVAALHRIMEEATSLTFLGCMEHGTNGCDSSIHCFWQNPLQLLVGKSLIFDEVRLKALCTLQGLCALLASSPCLLTVLRVVIFLLLIALIQLALCRSIHIQSCPGAAFR